MDRWTDEGTRRTDGRVGGWTYGRADRYTWAIDFFIHYKRQKYREGGLLNVSGTFFSFSLFIPKEKMSSFMPPFPDERKPRAEITSGNHERKSGGENPTLA